MPLDMTAMYVMHDLAKGVSGHLTHEEQAAVPLIERALTTARIGDDAPQILP